MSRIRLCSQGFALLFALFAGAAGATHDETADLEALQAEASSSRPGHGVVASPRSLACSYARRDTMVTAAAGDSRLVFVTQPLSASVAVLAASRLPRSRPVPSRRRRSAACPSPRPATSHPASSGWPSAPASCTSRPPAMAASTACRWPR